MNWYKKANNTDMFARGYCSEFAIALHQITNWPIYVFEEIEKDEDENEEYGLLVHVAVKTPDNRFADIRGIRTEQEISSHLLDSNLNQLTNYRITPYTQQNLEAEQDIDQELVSMATDYILKHKKAYLL